MLRGRTVTLGLLILATIYHFRGRDQKAAESTSSAMAPAPPQQLSGLDIAKEGNDVDAADDEESEEEAEEEVFEEEFIRTANSSELLARLRAGGRRAVQTGQWRRNRKKITKLTSITSVKPSRGQAPSESVQQQQQQHQQQQQQQQQQEQPLLQEGNGPMGELRPQTASEWLSDQWSVSQRGPLAVGSQAQWSTQGFPRKGARAKILSDLAAADKRAAGSERRRRWMAHGSRSLCFQLQKVHKIVPGTTWGSLPQSQRSAWDVLHCDEAVARGADPGAMPRSASARRGGTTSATPSMLGRARRNIADTEPKARGARDLPGEGGGDSEGDLSPEAECAEMASAHRVVVGVTWGSLPEELRGRWNQLKCDHLVRRVVRQQANEHRSSRGYRSRRHQNWSGRTYEGAARWDPVDNSGAERARRAGSRSSSSSSSSSECVGMQSVHGVRVGQSWGTLSLQQQQRWTQLGCDRLVDN